MSSNSTMSARERMKQLTTNGRLQSDEERVESYANVILDHVGAFTNGRASVEVWATEFPGEFTERDARMLSSFFSEEGLELRYSGRSFGLPEGCRCLADAKEYHSFTVSKRT